MNKLLIHLTKWMNFRNKLRSQIIKDYILHDSIIRNVQKAHRHSPEDGGGNGYRLQRGMGNLWSGRNILKLDYC